MGPDADLDLGPRHRAVARVVAIVVVAAVAWPGVSPLVGGPASDGFPLSTYPMFTRDRGRVVDVPTVVALDGRGRVGRLPPQVIADTDQVLVAAAAVRRSVAAGPAAAAAMCAEVADRAVGRGDTVAVVVERHDAIDWSRGRREPLDRRVVAECPVGPGS